ncbi:redoxin domain-containing protein [bacterium]|nr:redoxin domain-containing protein [bacterium]
MSLFSLSHFAKDAAAFLFGCLILWNSSALAGDEQSAFANLKQWAHAADVQAAKKEWKNKHSSPPTHEEVAQLVESITAAAITVIDEGKAFERLYPNSQRGDEVRSLIVQTLSGTFGPPGLPVPKARAADVESVVREYLKTNPNDFSLNLVLCHVAAALPFAKACALYEELSAPTTPGPARSMAIKALAKLKQIGNPIEFGFTALDGRSIELKDLRGKVVLLDFWATTCLPCVTDLPDLKKLYDRYQTKGVEFIGISMDTDKQTLERFIQKQQIDWPQYFDPAGMTNRFATEYGIDGIPVVWLVDKRGNLRYVDARWSEAEKIEKLLSEP